VTSLFSSLISGSYSATNLYENLLNRAPQASDGSCETATGSALVGCFETITGYPVSSSENPVGPGTNNEFQSTGTYSGTDHTNALYVQMLYYVILDRNPDSLGFSFWLGIANDGGPGVLFQGPAGYNDRIQILGPGTAGQGFIGSAEFQNLFAN
jgi:hypothetical protein